jgi:hypothetical protein
VLLIGAGCLHGWLTDPIASVLDPDEDIVRSGRDLKGQGASWLTGTAMGDSVGHQFGSQQLSVVRGRVVTTKHLPDESASRPHRCGRPW